MDFFRRLIFFDALAKRTRMSTTNRKFKTEVQQLLDLVVHSLYSNREIFLRELISNASDAIDKARFLGVTDKSVAEPEDGWRVTLFVNKETGTMSISDNGIGMTAEEVEANIGTIASSGTKAFLEGLSEEDKSRPELIGQFGVGFYAAFMVADSVELVTKRAGGEFADAPATVWRSNGDGTYEIGETEKDEPGTSILLHMKEDATEYLDNWKLRQIVKQYSDYVGFPIILLPDPKDVAEMEKQKEEAEEDEKANIHVPQPETLNSMQAIWTRPKSQVTEDEHKEFYTNISKDFFGGGPARTVHIAAEGRQEFKALLYLPAKKAPEQFRSMQGTGVSLYVKRVQIMEECEALLPEYLNFVRGVVDSSDLSLNVSRELLQSDRTVAAIRKSIVGKILGNLADFREKDAEGYRAWFAEFGAHLKDGACREDEHKDKLLDLLIFKSTKTEENEWITFKDYVSRMKPDQDKIYVLTGEPGSIATSPHLEAFNAKDLEVLLLDEPIDEWLIDRVRTVEDYTLEPVFKADIDLVPEAEREAAEKAREEATAEHKDLLEAIGEQLEETVGEVRLSERLTDSAACLVAMEGGMSSNRQRIMKAFGQEVHAEKRILELNPKHELLAKLKQLHADGDDKFATYVELVHGQALVADGTVPADPARFAKLIAELMV